MEHDACGVGFVAQIDGTRSHELVESSILAVVNVTHRGAVSAERLITHRTSLTGAVEDIPHWATEKRGLIKAMIDID